MTDPYLARFAQADTIVPGGVQGYDRYAYVLNNPVRYNDPSGHNENCGIGMGCVGDPTPGMIMADAIHQRVKHKEDQIGFNLTTKEIEQINDYMKSHPNYDPIGDPLFVSAKPAQKWFEQARLDYWGEIVPWPPKERMSYMEYYDFNQTVIAHGFDPSRVSWGNVLLDVAGIPLALFGAGEIASSLKLSETTIEASSGLGRVASTTSAASAQDGFGLMVAGGGAFPGPVGAGFSAISLVLDLNKGFYEYEWLPGSYY